MASSSGFRFCNGQVVLSCLPPGVPCDESPKGAAGKPTVCHNLKQYAINHAALVG